MGALRIESGARVVAGRGGVALPRVLVTEPEFRLAGAALDVFTHEPYRPVDAVRDLRSLPNVLLTPPVGSHTTEANRAMATRALHTIRLAEGGRLEEMDRLTP
jgi:phosphoglycerate dehydrogenase-like enzyme